MNLGDSPQLVADGNATFGARWKPCDLCGHIDSDYGVGPSSSVSVYFATDATTNARNLIPDT